MFSAVSLHEQLAPTTATRSYDHLWRFSCIVLYVVFTIWFCSWRSDAAVPDRHAFEDQRRSVSRSWGGWCCVGRDIHGVRPFGSRPTLLGWLAHSRPSVGRGQIGAIACPSHLRLSDGTDTVHTMSRCLFSAAIESRWVSGDASDGRHPGFQFPIRQTSRTRVVQQHWAHEWVINAIAVARWCVASQPKRTRATESGDRKHFSARQFLRAGIQVSLLSSSLRLLLLLLFAFSHWVGSAARILDFQNVLSWASSGVIRSAGISLRTQSIHFPLGLPLGLFPGALMSTTALTSLFSSILCMCPYQRSLISLTFSCILVTPSSFLMSSSLRQQVDFMVVCAVLSTLT